MPVKWKIEFYKDAENHEPVREYISSVRADGRAMVLLLIERLENLGPEIQGTKMDKLIEGSIRELRKDRHRILYGRDGNCFVLLTAFLKRTDKTPSDEIKLAKKRFEEYLHKKHK